MKLFFIGIVLSVFGVSTLSYSQDVAPLTPVSQQPLTKIDKFTSKNGVIIKFEDYNCSGLNQTFGIFAETRIRKVYSDSDVKLFYQVSNQTKYGSNVASVAYEDFIELNKALISLKTQLTSDLKSPANYLENKYTTDDGFQLGYWVSNGRATWYMKLEKYGSGSLISLKNVDTIEDSFKCAIGKFSELE